MRSTVLLLVASLLPLGALPLASASADCRPLAHPATDWLVGCSYQGSSSGSTDYCGTTYSNSYSGEAIWVLGLVYVNRGSADMDFANGGHWTWHYLFVGAAGKDAGIQTFSFQDDCHAGNGEGAEVDALGARTGAWDPSDGGPGAYTSVLTLLP